MATFIVRVIGFLDDEEGSADEAAAVMLCALEMDDCKRSDARKAKAVREYMLSVDDLYVAAVGEGQSSCDAEVGSWDCSRS